ncbi:hypothetical protein [Nocardioides sp. W7]|uniref:hypothetical protein n=1 Tax=Nocardioides sp. W7 TaxID=2931390 RepID=UPI001FD453B3|nr:hypothetical protein [Nocardioides sp. W7]
MSTSTDKASRAASAARDARVTESARKIRKPFVLDPTLCLYSPQENVEALEHPRVAEWLGYVREEWWPTEVPGSRTRLALLLPCTKYKPYLTSREHRAINTALLGAGWRPVEGYDGPPELRATLDDGEPDELLATAPLERDGVVLDRFVVSEPMGLVPYEHTLFLPAALGGGPASASAYDDPGLFESRGTSVSPERDDCTATQRADGSWAWGPAEREAFATMHNAMADTLTRALERLAPSYDAILGWVSPGLTHRSFLAGAGLRAAEGIPTFRLGASGPVPLRGVLDTLPGAVEVLPTPEQSAAAREQLAVRLAAEGRPAGPGSVRAVFARGDGHDTPLGLPELTAALVARLDEVAR